MKKLSMILLIAAILSAAILAGCSQPIDNPEYTSTADGVRIITENTAKRAAAEHANLTIDDVKYTKAVLDTDDGRKDYDIEFVHNGYEYEVEVNAEDGSINSYDKEKIDNDIIPALSNNEPEPINTLTEVSTADPKDVKYITEGKALTAALTKAELAGVSKDYLLKLRIEFEIDDGVPEYEVDFIYDGFEYDITVNADNCDIIKFEKEVERANASTPPSESFGDATDKFNNIDINNNSAFTELSLIGEETAIAKALEHAGVDATNIYGYEIDFDKDDGILKYEVEFISGGYEYSYDIDATDGSILKSEKEIDD